MSGKSGISATVQTLLSLPAVQSAVGQVGSTYKIAMFDAEQGWMPPWIVVTAIYEPDEQHLAGRTGFNMSRVSIECVHTTKNGAYELGQIILALGDLHLRVVGSYVVSFFKEGTEVTDAADDRSTFRRVVDYYVSWR